MGQEQGAGLDLVFFGTPAFAATILDALDQAPDLHVKAVVTQPDRPCGRGRTCRPSTVKKMALSLGYPVFEPHGLKGGETVSRLAEIAADVFVVAAYGLLLPRTVLDMPRLGSLNVHASLLPRYRGASPIQAALQHGDKVTGITIMRMVEALDAGPILLQRALGIGITDTAQSLHDQLAGMGGRMIVEALRGMLCGSLACIEQDHALASYAPKLTKDQGRIHWNRPAMEVHDHIRAMHPWPGAFFPFTAPGQRTRNICVLPGAIGAPLARKAAPGTFLGLRSASLAIACEDREYLVDRLHPANARIMDARAFACGYLQDQDVDDAACQPKDRL